jgi:hypothetical protein
MSLTLRQSQNILCLFMLLYFFCIVYVTKAHLYNKQVLRSWLIDGNLLLRDFEPYGILIFMNVCAVITVAMVMLLRDFG